MTDKILILDFGSQYTQLIARRVREAHVYCEIKPWNAAEADLLDPETRGVILSGGPLSVYAPDAPKIPTTILQSNLPILGICYGMQAFTIQSGGEVTPAQEHEYGLATIQVLMPNPLLPEGEMIVWMSHGDRIKQQPPGWQVLARSANSPIAAIGDLEKQRFGLQFHPEVRHTPQGAQILRRFVIDICGCKCDWTPASIIEQSVANIRAQVGQGLVLSAVSGGVDSSVATALAQRALGEQVYSVFIDTGLLRKGERQQVEATFRPLLGERLMVVDASERFLSALQGITDPETKRRIIGETFIREFEAAARQIGPIEYLVQGTIYPDVVESQGLGASQAQRIKSHHNVGGLPADLHFKLVEPLRLLFKDEVRAVGEALGLPHNLIWRQPFPGPGLAVRCLGEITRERLETLREADAIFTEELERVGLLQVQEDFTGTVQGTSQAFAVLLPIKTVGVMGDQRSYQEVVALRAVTTTDFMTADWARLPEELLARVSNRIVNEIPKVNRVVYDITSKPPATIEWE
ncbi:MAG TPA: glutamine-hydrolyzing GMP synthase [Anaerolineaceae bacterium]|jgi:GMP synthase (glutamine-hydrolysing)|nr:GMP synthase (glutamine-hydrolyzing) [Anaerolineaceae bacterium]HOV30112.1 glutamine-hydrolyzing GMP synthase [Anaerolineaceae bacterium]HUM48970.1 glutamine-hydrolyzing GMP synthase [Anaerolineaceae bacterium]